TPDVAVTHRAREGRLRPILQLNRHNVGVVEQYDGVRLTSQHRIAARQPRDQALAFGRWRVEGALDPFATEQIGEPARRDRLVAGWVAGVQRNVFGEQTHRLFVQGVPVDRDGRGHRRLPLAVMVGASYD